LPWAERTRDDLADTHADDATLERVAINGVAIPQQPARRRVVRKGLNHLLRCPRGGGMFRDVETNNSSALVREQDKHEQHAACQGGDREEIHRHQRGDMIGEKGPPRL